ncbi:TetR/AcrR family transcriptional regulator [Microbulbifer hainanensis]|uniref:TetR/AcrR family transcriptional regulator n=1 Tax=Microbulbifer hainanensis TaxID=2735675 RepID=UPI00186757AB|nr:TetR/AcrR family transcriptional regulator [Microbulbifer hainanensis]
MRYSKEHKAQTRERIVEEASRRFRRDGIGATGLQALMKALGLTHGGFYAHFKSKDELVETALQHAVAERDTAVDEYMAGEHPLETLIDQYLSGAHRNHAEQGCPLPTMAAELGQRGEPSATTDQLVKKRLQQIAGGLDGDDADERSMLILAAMVGALQLSRSVKSKRLSNCLLESTGRLLGEMTAEA